MTRALVLIACLLTLATTPGCGLIALTAFGMYVIDHPEGPPKAAPSAPTTTAAVPPQ